MCFSRSVEPWATRFSTTMQPRIATSRREHGVNSRHASDEDRANSSRVSRETIGILDAFADDDRMRITTRCASGSGTITRVASIDLVAFVVALYACSERLLVQRRRGLPRALRSCMTTTKAAKQIRRLTLALAREYASQGRHDEARTLFASQGISYNPSTLDEGVN